MELNIQIKGLDRFAKNLAELPIAIQETGRSVITKSTEAVKVAVQANSPVRTGNLRSSVHSIASGFQGLVFIDQGQAPYAGAVIYGSPAHLILPVRRAALWWPEASHPVSSVSHPGNKANPFFEKGIAEALPVVEDLGKVMLDALAKELEK